MSQIAQSLSIKAPATERQRLTTTVKRLAAEHGLTIARVTTGEAFPGLAELLTERIAAGHLAGMDWFTPERAQVSADPKQLFSTVRSIVSVGIPYWSQDPGMPDDQPRGRIARYAWGVDYHKLLKRRMRGLHRAIEAHLGYQIESRQLVDHARIIDRAVAARAGLGWYGKHSCLIVPGHGSWVMLGELLLDLDLEPDAPLTKDCGRCSICLDRCPTGAIVAPYVIDAPKCLSFQTIEQRGAIPSEMRSLMSDWVFGCDVCQDVCPYTLAAKPEPDSDFLPRHVEHAYPPLRWLLAISDEEFRATYAGMATLRAKRVGMARNAAVALGNIGTAADVATLITAATRDLSPLVRGHAAWALWRLSERDQLDGQRNVTRETLYRLAASDPDSTVRDEARSALDQAT